ncbi:MAG: methyltransferase domain-containing protein [Gemmatimonadetes bacterium]|jgi:SAM-dependent methyltransferase|nr:methyltransferase domain-containing protein [Gemmatimonadota bacterium]
MPPTEAGTEVYAPTVPSMLDLVRLSPRLLFPPGGVDLYRQIAVLTEMGEDGEVLDVACGKGVSLEYFVKEFGVHGSGVDVDPTMIEQAEARSRDEGIADRLQFQTGRSDALPYRDEIFDATVGEIGLSNHCEPAAAISELVRVTKPGGIVVLVQLVWKAPVDEQRRVVLADHLGARPLMVVEWKRLLRESGISTVHTEDWSDEETAFRPTVAKPFPDFAELFSVGEKIGILRRAWTRWGWRGVRTVLEREREVHRLLTRERILGLDLLKGRKGEAAEDSVARAEAESAPPDHESQTETATVGEETVTVPEAARDDEREETDTAGLPLFGSDADKPTH